MSQTAENIFDTYTELRGIAGGASRTSSTASLSIPTTDVMILGLLLCTLQVLDGVLTGIGMYHFGTSAEGNFLLRALMEYIGCTPALVLAKTFAIGIVCILCCLTKSVSWLKNALIGVTLIYLGAAIIPWTAIIFTRIL